MPAEDKAKKQTSHGHEPMVAMLLDSKKPAELRAQMLIGAFQSGDMEGILGLSVELLKALESAGPSAELKKLKSTYEQALQELEQGSVRPATYVEVADCDFPGPKPRLHVITPDGQQRFPFVHSNLKPDQLAPGQTVLLDPKGTVVLGCSRVRQAAGPQASFIRRLPNSQRVEVSIRDETVTLYAAQQVLDAESAGELRRGTNLLIGPQQQFAFDVVPEDQDRQHRFVDPNKLPNVLPQRDIGKPHPCLEWLVRRTRILMFRDDLRERFELRPRVSLLMTGPSGTGKTLTIKAFLTIFRHLLLERTGRDNLTSRVIRVKLSEHLSEWLGRTDTNFDRLFDDIQKLAAEEVETASGERIRLPVIVIFEEVEGIARRRSLGDHDGTGGAMDRIMGTLLQRLDDPLDELSQLKLVIISTSNRESMIDSAMHRRLGAKVARFKRLDRQGLAAVLGKKVRSDYPLSGANGRGALRQRQRLIDEVVANLFDPQNDPVARLEVTLGDGTKLQKFARDFLTGALIEQAIAEAIDELTFLAEETSDDDIGLNSVGVIDTLRRQINALADNVTPHNAADYIDVPEHTHVANVRRLQGSNGSLTDLVAPSGNGR